MYPTLALSGDFILQSRLTTLFPSLSSRFPLERGTLVTAISPSDPSHQVLKRVIGIAGDTICVDPSGERARERRLKREAGSEGDGINIITGLEFLEGATTMRTEQRIGQEEIEMEDEEPKWIKIPKGRVWLSGDNASNSTDSRDYGPVPVALLRGRVVARVSFFRRPAQFFSPMRRRENRTHSVSSFRCGLILDGLVVTCVASNLRDPHWPKVRLLGVVISISLRMYFPSPSQAAVVLRHSMILAHEVIL